LRAGTLSMTCLIVALASAGCDAKQPAGSTSKQALTHTSSCPQILTAQTVIPTATIMVGTRPAKPTPLIYSNLGNASVGDVKNRSISEEMIDVWDYLPNGDAVSYLQYPKPMTDFYLFCVYGLDKMKSGYFEKQNFVLFHPIPTKNTKYCKFTYPKNKPVTLVCSAAK
jgi:hypothetical protein